MSDLAAAVNAGVFSAAYFNRTAQITAKNPRNAKMQIFQRKQDTVLCGVQTVLNMFDHVPGREQLTIKTLWDGDIVQPWEPVATIEGPYHLFARYESVYLGIFARCSRVATNMRRLVDAASGKQVFMFGDRFDGLENQVWDGYAAAVGGASAVCTDAMLAGAQSAGFDIPSVGTMPHALIAMHDGNVVEACRSFHAEFPDVPMHALVDFNNDCVNDSLACLKEFGTALAGVRLDTSAAMMDESLARLFESNGEKILRYEENARNAAFRGVNRYLVGMVRKALDENGGKHVKITVSGGFNADKIADFENEGVPVDIYAVGSSVVTSNPIDFTADLVVPCAKQGRSEQDDSRLSVR